MIFGELFEKIQEASKDREYVPTSLYQKVFTPKQRKIIEKLIELQKKYRELYRELEALKAQKGELEPVVIQTLEKLKVNGIKLDKILLYLKEYHSAPSFKEVFAEVESQLTPKIAKLLTDAYDKLRSEKAGKSIVVQFKESQEVSEDLKGAWQKIVNWFKTKFSKAVDSVGNVLDRILNLAKEKAKEAEDKGEVVLKGTQLGWGLHKPLVSEEINEQQGEVLRIQIPATVKVNERLKKLIEEYGEQEVVKALGDYFEYEVLKNIGDVYKGVIELGDADLDALEEILSE